MTKKFIFRLCKNDTKASLLNLSGAAYKNFSFEALAFAILLLISSADCMDETISASIPKALSAVIWSCIKAKRGEMTTVIPSIKSVGS